MLYVIIMLPIEAATPNNKEASIFFIKLFIYISYIVYSLREGPHLQHYIPRAGISSLTTLGRRCNNNWRCGELIVRVVNQFVDHAQEAINVGTAIPVLYRDYQMPVQYY